MTVDTKKAWSLAGGQAHSTAPSRTLSKYTTIVQALVDVLATRGITGLAICADGEVHRFDAPGKRRGNLAGWYVCPTPERAVFGFWHTGEQQTVTLNGPSDPEAAAHARLEAMRERERRDRERREGQARAAEQARRWWSQAGLADPGHPYLTRKHLLPHHLRQRGDTLLMPLFFEGELVNLERIFPDGRKRPLNGGRVKGAASLIGRLAGAERVLVAEGWSTAAALHEAMGCPVVVARNAANLLPVARRLRRRLPEVDITLCGDDDRHLLAQGLPNKGRIAARHAALAIDAKLLMPTFCDGCKTCTDFADVRLCRLGGSHD